MKIREVLTRVVKISAPDDPLKGTAGLHGVVSADGVGTGTDYHRVPPYHSFYSNKIETLLVKIVGDDGTVGVGECQSPVVPEVVQVIVRELLAPMLLGQDPLDVEGLWNRLYYHTNRYGRRGCAVPYRSLRPTARRFCPLLRSPASCYPD